MMCDDDDDVFAGMVTRKDLLEAQLLRRARGGGKGCRRRRQRQRDSGDSNSSTSSQLMRLSLPASQQLSPLRVAPSSTSFSLCTAAAAAAAGEDVYVHDSQSRTSTSTSNDSGPLDDSMNNSLGSSSRGLLEGQQSQLRPPVSPASARPDPFDTDDGAGGHSAPGEEKRGGGNKLLDFFFPSNAAANRDNVHGDGVSGGVQLVDASRRSSGSSHSNNVDSNSNGHFYGISGRDDGSTGQHAIVRLTE
jgi:hypothetical protein